MALVKAPPVGGLARYPTCPNPQCKVTETHLKRVYAAEAQATLLSNTVSVLTAYMDCVLHEELHLQSRMLLQISSLQGQALGQSLVSLIVVHRQLWLSQARVPDADKAKLLDKPISQDIPLGQLWRRSQREREASPAGGCIAPSPRFRVGQVEPLGSSSELSVPVPTTPLGDLRHRLQGTPAANNRAHLAGGGNAGRGQQEPRRHFQCQRPRQSPQTAPPQPQQPEQGP
ncbi:UNVERIFIED_CONTAM: hypothetical protein FKN15_039123 [Acipenser sinensis]